MFYVYFFSPKKIFVLNFDVHVFFTISEASDFELKSLIADFVVDSCTGILLSLLFSPKCALILIVFVYLFVIYCFLLYQWCRERNLIYTVFSQNTNVDDQPIKCLFLFFTRLRVS